MSYAERIENTMAGLDLKKPIFNVRLSKTRISLNEEAWSPGLEENNVINCYINRYARRQYDGTIKKYVVDFNRVVREFEEDLESNMIQTFTKCSPNKEPRRTNIYKDFCSTLRRNRHDQKFRDSLFNIYEYYWSNTQQKAISHPDNSVHRTNIYNLLCLMEKSYGNGNSGTSSN